MAEGVKGGKPGATDPSAWKGGLVLLLALVVFFYGLGGLCLTDRDEGEYATIVQTMISTGDYVTPQLNFKPYYEKPILYFWLSTLAFKNFGANEFAIRFWSALSGVLVVMAVYVFGRAAGPAGLGFTSALTLLASLLFSLIGRSALLDMTLTLFISLALFFFYYGWQSFAAGGKKAQGRYFTLFFAFMGLAFLTKGPVGVVIPLLVVVPFLLLNRSLMPVIRRMPLLIGFSAFLLLAAPWYLLAMLKNGSAFIDGFFVSQNIRRFTEVLLGHGGGYFYYLPVLILGFFPFFGFAVPTAVRAVKAIPWQPRQVTRDNQAAIFCLIWVAAGLIILSIAQTKQFNYILPIFPPLAILAGLWWQDYLDGQSKSLWERRVGVAFVLVPVAILAIAFAALPRFLVSEQFTQLMAKANTAKPDSFEYAFGPGDLSFGWVPYLLLLVLPAGGAGFFHFFQRGQRKHSFIAIIAMSMVFQALVFLQLFPTAAAYMQQPAKELALAIKSGARPEAVVATYGLYKPSLFFYVDRPILHIKVPEKDKLKQFLASRSEAYLLSREVFLKELQQDNNFHLLKLAGGYILGYNKRTNMRR
ncbi:MAG: glycosyltransferase family 39 protein [Deltaproteobacteria bacterium]|nr:glycosyltransferase family 39 protein [Deltaproteobacteria bacterium]